MDPEETKVSAPTKPAKKPKTKKKVKTPKRKTKKVKKTGDSVARSARLDMRITKTERAKIVAKAKKLRRTITSIVIEAIEKLR